MSIIIYNILCDWHVQIGNHQPLTPKRNPTQCDYRKRNVSNCHIQLKRKRNQRNAQPSLDPPSVSRPQLPCQSRFALTLNTSQLQSLLLSLSVVMQLQFSQLQSHFLDNEILFMNMCHHHDQSWNRDFFGMGSLTTKHIVDGRKSSILTYLLGLGSYEFASPCHKGT